MVEVEPFNLVMRKERQLKTLQTICWVCSGTGLVIDRTEYGYTVYKSCPQCRKGESNANES